MSRLILDKALKFFRARPSDLAELRGFPPAVMWDADPYPIGNVPMDRAFAKMCVGSVAKDVAE